MKSSFMTSSTPEMNLLRFFQVFLPFLPTLILTYHWQSRSSWTQTLERGHNRCQIDTGRTPGVDCGQNLLGELAQTLGWSWDPRDSVPLMCHCPHRNCEQRERVTLVGALAHWYLSRAVSLISAMTGRYYNRFLLLKITTLNQRCSSSMFAWYNKHAEFELQHYKQANKQTHNCSHSCFS